MATATAHTVKTTEVTLHLDREEALVLWHLTRIISGDNATPALVTRGIGEALREAFRGDVSLVGTDPFKVFGGKCVARTEGMLHLEQDVTTMTNQSPGF